MSPSCKKHSVDESATLEACATRRKHAYFDAECTSISGILLVLMRTLESRDIDCRSQFSSIGLDVSHVRNPTARVPTAKMARAWQIAVDSSGDHAIGLRSCEHLHAAVWYAMSYVFFASESVLTALQRMVLYQRVIVTVANVKLHETADAYVLTWGGHPQISEQSLDMYGGTIIQMCRRLTGTRFSPLSVSLARKTPDCGGRYHEKFFHAPVRFSAGENALYLPKAPCRKILLIGNDEILGRNELLVNEYLKRVKTHEFINLVHSRIIESFTGGGMLEEHVAQSMNLSQRSLQRRLQAQGTSFRAIADSARRKYAMELVHDTELLISEIGYRLGYANVGNFSSAFKRWTGLSPSEYRSRQMKTGV